MSSEKNPTHQLACEVVDTGSGRAAASHVDRRAFLDARTLRQILASAVCLLAVCFFVYDGNYLYTRSLWEGKSEARLQNGSEFVWDEIKPSPSLQYHSCYDGFQCARLEIPLDWNSTAADGGPRMAIAIIKRPAQVSVVDPRYGGPLLINPGGPGGSGVIVVKNFGDAIAALLDPSLNLNPKINAKDTSNVERENENSTFATAEKYFDIVGWDPRSVGQTTPFPNCYPETYPRWAWRVARSTLGFDVVEDSIAYAKIFERELAYGQACSRLNHSDSEAGHIGQYVSTANEVRNMVEILERHGEWREETALHLTRGRDSERADIKARLGWRRGEEPLNFWGFSYGTLLGMAFATMQPHRIGRIILDGNVDADNYMAGAWTTNLEDIDKITAHFAAKCWEVGRIKCPLWDIRGPDAILPDLWTLLEDIRAIPVPRLSKDGTPQIWTYSDVVSVIFDNWYNAYYGFEVVAHLLADLRRPSFPGSFTVPTFAPIDVQHPLPPAPTPGSPSFSHDETHGGLPIRCGDGPVPLNSTTRASFLASHLAPNTALSALFGPLWATWIPLMCVGYTVRPKWRFAGPFGASAADAAHPILFATTALDPVTPVKNAYVNAQLFPGSAVLETQDGVGHCSVSMPSLGMIGAMRAYLAEGVFPAEGERKFRASVKVFSSGDENGGGGLMEGVDERLKEAVLKFANGWVRYLGD